MKKLTALLSVLFLGATISLAGCKKDEKKDEGAAKTTEKKEEPKAEEKKEEPKAEEKKEEPAAGGAATGLAECDAYVTAVEKFMACDKVPEAARDGAKQGLEAMKSGWGDASAMPDEAKKAANDACKQAIDALKQGASAMGCEM